MCAFAAQRAQADCKVQAVTFLKSNFFIADDTANNPNVGLVFTPAPNVAGNSIGLPISAEGLTERVADLLIYDDGVAPSCFQPGQTITLTYNARITIPAVTDLDVNLGAVLDIYDSCQFHPGQGSCPPVGPPFSVFSTTTVANATNGNPQTIISLAIGTFGGLPGGSPGDLTTGLEGSAIRIRNLRADATLLAGPGGLPTSPGIFARISATQGALNGTPAAVIVGDVKPIIAFGAGLRFSGTGLQNANATLANPAQFGFAENFGAAFRLPSNTGVIADIPDGATSLVFRADSVPPGVTITFPGSMSTSAQPGLLPGAGIIFTARGGQPAPCVGPGSCTAVYDTTANGAAQATLIVNTALLPDDGSTGNTPAIGVKIGSSSGFGTASISAFISPTVTKAFNGDDQAQFPLNQPCPSPVPPGQQCPTTPQYTSNTVPAGGASRQIFSGTWFTVNSVVPVAVVTPASINFGTQVIGVSGAGKTVTISNAANATALNIASIAIAGANAAEFTQTNPCPATLAPGASCAINVVFSPFSAGSRTATLVITDDAPGSPHTVALTGVSLSAAPVPVVNSLSPSVLLAGGGAFTLTVNGSGFVTGAVLRWNGSPRPTTVLGETRLTAQITADDIATASTAAIIVLNPSPGGGPSNLVSLQILPGPVPTTPFVAIVPHIVKGGGFVTKITIVNLSVNNNTLSINTIDQSGTLLEASNVGLAGSGSMRIVTSEQERFGPTIIRWMAIGSQAPIAVNVFFEISLGGGPPAIVNTVGFNDPPQLTEFTLPVEFEPKPANANIGRTVGLALANVSGQTNTVTMKLVDPNGATVAARTLTIGAYSQTAVDLAAPDLFGPVLPNANFVGTMIISATAPVSAVALLDDFGPFSAIPVIKGKPQ
ncbi:MAG TPA: choice-of-anchor D domain-containing protein [Terriglobales bacterium]|nr:choice-of-anchor D domain-containing protein [Terriglobales bacterium]